MKNYFEPVGPDNNHIIKESLKVADQVICGWGNHGAYLDQAKKVLKIIEDLGTHAYHLGLTKNNQPKHPLYISYNQEPIEWLEKETLFITV